jgi:hypothetical protein
VATSKKKKDPVVDGLKKDIGELNRETFELKKVIENQRLLIKERDEIIANLKESPDAPVKEHVSTDFDDALEIVALPAPGCQISPKKYKGEIVESKIDKYGYYHWLFPRKNAIQILSATAGMKHVLVGPDDEIKAMVPRGRFQEEVVIRRHVMREIPGGKTRWIEVIVEESK